jgi:transcriptional regulator with XRE-family HTH domain
MTEKFDVKAIFASNLLRLRINARLSQRELAEKSGFATNFIYDLENQKKGCSTRTIGRLAEALNVEPMQFFLSQDQWDNIEKQHCIAILNELRNNINNVIENYQKNYFK